MDEPEFKWIRTDRRNRCSGCRGPIEIDELVLWSLIDKKHVWCQDCGEDSGVLPLPNPLPAVSKIKVLPKLSNINESCVSTTSTMTVTPTITTTPTPIAPSREDNIKKAHDENMKANENLCLHLGALTASVVDLMRVEQDRNALLKQGLKQ